MEFVCSIFYPSGKEKLNILLPTRIKIFIYLNIINTFYACKRQKFDLKYILLVLIL